MRYPILQRTTKTNELQYSSCILNMPKRCFKHQFKGLTCNIIVEKLRCHRELNVHVYTEYLQFKLYDYKYINCWLNSGFLTFLQSAYFSIFSFPRQRLIMMGRLSSHREFIFPFLFTRITPTGGSLPPSDTRTISGHLLVNYV